MSSSSKIHKKYDECNYAEVTPISELPYFQENIQDPKMYENIEFEIPKENRDYHEFYGQQISIYFLIFTKVIFSFVFMN